MSITPNQNRNRNKADHKTATKITDEEKKRLSRACREADALQNSLAMLTLNRKLAMDKIEANFQAQWNAVFPQAENKARKRNDIINDLNEKYGEADFNYDNGQIIRPDVVEEK